MNMWGAGDVEKNKKGLSYFTHDVPDIIFFFKKKLITGNSDFLSSH